MQYELNDQFEFTAEAALVQRTVLPGGVRVLTETVPGAPSVAIAMSVPVGSRDESAGQFGSTHFLEHLLFKGTPKRSALDISVAFDSVGGSSNAATAKEYTSYYARVQNQALGLAVDVIGDMFTSAKISEQDFITEKTVILEEIAMNEDDPEDVAHEAMAEALLPGHELGRPIGGTPDTIRAVSRESVVQHYLQHYRPETLVVTAAGGVSHSELLGLVQRTLDNAANQLPHWSPVPGSPSARRSQAPAQLPQNETFRHVKKVSSQANILLGAQSISGNHPDRYALGILSTILGGGMSSRLYQKIREQRGLAYSTYSYQQGYSDAGYFGMYAGCAPENAEQVIGLMRDELESLAVDGATAAELELALGNISGGMALRFESSMARMNRLFSAEIGSGEYLTLGETVDRFRAVSLQDVQSAAQRLQAAAKSLIVVGEAKLSKLSRLAD